MSTYFSEDHEWITVSGDTATIGITKHAAEQLGEIVFFEPKEPGEEFEKGDDIGVVESVKAASEIYAPVSGEVLEANSELEDEPGKLNEDPEGARLALQGQDQRRVRTCGINECRRLR